MTYAVLSLGVVLLLCVLTVRAERAAWKRDYQPVPLADDPKDDSRD